MRVRQRKELPVDLVFIVSDTERNDKMIQTAALLFFTPLPEFLSSLHGLTLDAVIVKRVADLLTFYENKRGRTTLCFLCLVVDCVVSSSSPLLGRGGLTV